MHFTFKPLTYHCAVFSKSILLIVHLLSNLIQSTLEFIYSYFQSNMLPIYPFLQLENCWKWSQKQLSSGKFFCLSPSHTLKQFTKYKYALCVWIMCNGENMCLSCKLVNWRYYTILASHSVFNSSAKFPQVDSWSSQKSFVFITAGSFTASDLWGRCSE